MRNTVVVSILAGLTISCPAALFEVPGHTDRLAALERLYDRHRVMAPDTTLWDAWLPMSLLWFETSRAPATDQIRNTYRDRLQRRPMDEEGYVTTQQHEGLGHSQGWPFPLWTQGGGVGWHFTLSGLPYGREFGVHRTESIADWRLQGLESVRLDPATGWTLRVQESRVVMSSPAFRVAHQVAPFLRVKFSLSAASSHGTGRVVWRTSPEAAESGPRSMAFSLPEIPGRVSDLDVPLHRHPGWSGTLTGFDLEFEGLAPGTEIVLQRVFTAMDTRHNVNNATYLMACDDYLRWTGDLEFLRSNIQRMRLALAWAIHEFEIAERNVVTTRWVGHDGRSGHRVGADGRRELLPGRGIGNNYWDLLPFGGEDALASIYYFDAIRRMAALERQIERHPEWNVPGGPLRFAPAELLELAEALRSTGNERFWNSATGRFAGWRDLEGQAYDYGFTFVNNEAIYYGFASLAHARTLREWLDGRRTVAGDTSTGRDIYHWGFGPRATTRRNTETYFWGWSDPASLPWGGQVQDGGGVLGFSFHDLMARLEVNGPDDAWSRLQEVIAWLLAVEEAGGYRAYYAEPARGTLQGGGTAGGLGLDHEFFESVLVPQVMLYGFLGFRSRLDGCVLAPQLPSDWPSLTVRNIRLHNLKLEVTAHPEKVEIQVEGTPSRPLRIFTPGDESSVVDIQEGRIEIRRPVAVRNR